MRSNDEFRCVCQAIIGPKILQESWDERATVRQKWVHLRFVISIVFLRDLPACFFDGYPSYARLGLACSLNPKSSGGDELGVYDVDPPIEDSEPSSAVDPSCKPCIPKGFGKIIRDSEGNVTGIEISQDDQDRMTDDGREKDMERIEADMTARLKEEGVLSSWVDKIASPIRATSKDVVRGEFHSFFPFGV
jgi:nucleolar protein 16